MNGGRPVEGAAPLRTSRTMGAKRKLSPLRYCVSTRRANSFLIVGLSPTDYLSDERKHFQTDDESARRVDEDSALTTERQASLRPSRVSKQLRSLLLLDRHDADYSVGMPDENPSPLHGLFFDVKAFTNSGITLGIKNGKCEHSTLASSVPSTLPRFVQDMHLLAIVIEQIRCYALRCHRNEDLPALTI